MARKQKGPVMREFLARARITLDGVTLFIEAENEDDARAMLANGTWSNEDYSGASAINWEIFDVEPNE